jgi:hypothetical protein
VLILGLILASCGQGPAPDNSASNLMPDLADYNATSVLNIQDALAKLTSLAAAAGAQIEISAGVTAISSLATCYEKAGAVVGQAYESKTNPVNAGLIVIVNKNVMTNPQTFIQCVLPKTNFSAPAGSTPPAQPCSKAYSLNQDNNTFYIAYVGTNSTVCQAFCSALKGCSTAP